MRRPNDEEHAHVTVTTPRPTSDDAATIAPGSVVVVRDEEWLVRATEPTDDGLLVRVQGLSELVRDTEAVFYDSVDTVTALDPAASTVVADTSSQYRTSRLWLESTIRKTAVPLADPSLSVSTRSLADTLAYQESAVTRALDPENLRPRILLADAVGLGKTIEIGMILAELVRRGRGERILVVTPRHVLEQMQHEMWTRFALPFVRLDSAGIQRVRQKLPATRNPFTYYKRVIISIDTLKSDRYVAHLSSQRWDAVVIDESHNLSNTATMNNRLAKTLAANADALVLASATPHNGKKDSFAALVKLLDPTAVTPGGDLVRDEVARLVVRRHRHSPEVAQVVGSDWAERQAPHNVLIKATPTEDAVARELDEIWLHPVAGRSPYSGQNSSLFPWTLAKAFLSSPAALGETVRDRRARLKDGSAADVERAALDRLAGLARTADQQPSAKYARLLEHLREIGVSRTSPARAVVFAERIATLRWLQPRLVKDLGLKPDAVAIMHGGLPDDQQQSIVEAFKQESSDLRVLITGDVASEGVNLHLQCHELVHFDIPWSLIRIEQRNGRIDRYGQKRPPRITTLVLQPSSEGFSGDIRVLSRLVEREHEAHTALGDVASLMGEYDVKGEEDEIARVLAGQRTLDDVVRTVDEVTAGDDLAAFFFGLGGTAEDDAEPAPDAETPQTGAVSGSGLYPDDITYLEEALHVAYVDPSGPAPHDGVAWQRDARAGYAELVPPPRPGPAVRRSAADLSRPAPRHREVEAGHHSGARQGPAARGAGQGQRVELAGRPLPLAPAPGAGVGERPRPRRAGPRRGLRRARRRGAPDGASAGHAHQPARPGGLGGVDQRGVPRRRRPRLRDGVRPPRRTRGSGQRRRHRQASKPRPGAGQRRPHRADRPRGHPGPPPDAADLHRRRERRR